MTTRALVSVILFSAAVVALLLYIIFHNIAFKNFFKKFKNASRQKYGFYECGFRARSEMSATYTIHNYSTLSMILLYDVESLLLIFLILSVSTASTLDIIFILFYVGLLLSGLVIDISCGVIEWQNY